MMQMQDRYIMCELPHLKSHSGGGRLLNPQVLDIVINSGGMVYIQEIKTKYFFDYSIDLKLRRSTVFIENIA